MPSHGGGRACYKGHRPKTGSCQPCRDTNARQHTKYNRSAAHRNASHRYFSTAKGFLTRVRYDAIRRDK